MAKLVVVEGKSGSGKTASTEFLEANCYARCTVDEYIDRCRTTGIKFDDVLQVLRTGTKRKDFFKRFYQKINLPYDIDYARYIMSSGAGSTGYGSFAVSYAIWNTYLKDRDNALSTGTNVAMDTFAHPSIRAMCLNSDRRAERYLVVLNIPDDEIAIERKVLQHPKRNRVDLERGIRKSIEFSTDGIDPDVTVLHYDNSGTIEQLHDFLRTNLL